MYFVLNVDTNRLINVPRKIKFKKKTDFAHILLLPR